MSTLCLLQFMMKHLHYGHRCTVCLSDYQPDDLLQQLPICSHAFHKECIDTWLTTRITCPLCRLPLTPAKFLWESQFSRRSAYRSSLAGDSGEASAQLGLQSCHESQGTSSTLQNNTEEENISESAHGNHSEEHELSRDASAISHQLLAFHNGAGN
ncbi:hypothetical protein Tsubulata_001430 [Turnera subulata]|uniref:RING-type domain-containing protein n=1 Tax=Turnera subulata TaxID=218843 RepID=A0A9Q0FDR4_9ROSI|nr:hypothetical protein Tsubulata_001430 [Turnera subulata]